MVVKSMNMTPLANVNVPGAPYPHYERPFAGLCHLRQWVNLMSKTVCCWYKLRASLHYRAAAAAAIAVQELGIAAGPPCGDATYGNRGVFY